MPKKGVDWKLVTKTYPLDSQLTQLRFSLVMEIIEHLKANAIKLERYSLEFKSSN